MIVSLHPSQSRASNKNSILTDVKGNILNHQISAGIGEPGHSSASWLTEVRGSKSINFLLNFINSAWMSGHSNRRIGMTQKANYLSHDNYFSQNHAKSLEWIYVFEIFKNKLIGQTKNKWQSINVIENWGINILFWGYADISHRHVNISKRSYNCLLKSIHPWTCFSIFSTSAFKKVSV